MVRLRVQRSTTWPSAAKVSAKWLHAVRYSSWAQAAAEPPSSSYTKLLVCHETINIDRRLEMTRLRGRRMNESGLWPSTWEAAIPHVHAIRC